MMKRLPCISVTADDPENYDVLDMAQVLLQGDLDSAEAIVERLPDAHRVDPRAKSIAAGKAFRDLLAGAPDRATCESRIEASDEDSEARYFLAVHLMVSDDVESAITHY